ncbi:MAG: DUF2851 family protein [Balneolaceae bacterium]|nr:DUF2851 family protein [Balneolaceae bacterium]
MTKPGPYREELFQWIWQNLEFDCSNLKTVCGKSLSIIETGELNHGAGPDFLGAHLRINGRDWFGSVEIHREAGEWFQHNHHHDENFNSVILHVIYDDHQDSSQAETKDGHQPFTLVLKPAITKKTYRLLEAKQQDGIPCSGNVSFLNQEVFESQVEKAHQEYLEFKINELLEFYDASLPISRAWKNSLIIGIYKTLGIPANKNQMVHLAKHVLAQGFSNELPVIEEVQETAFGSDNGIQWIYSGMRPASRPERRVKQAAVLHKSVHQISFQHFFRCDPIESWNYLLEDLDSSLLPGESRLSLIWQIVFLPALYFLGDLLHSADLKQQVFQIWKTPGQHIPKEIKKPFKKAGFKLNSSTNIIGLAHQYKRYCSQKNCHRCEVFKKAIRS